MSIKNPAKEKKHKCTYDGVLMKKKVLHWYCPDSVSGHMVEADRYKGGRCKVCGGKQVAKTGWICPKCGSQAISEFDI